MSDPPFPPLTPRRDRGPVLSLALVCVAGLLLFGACDDPSPSPGATDTTITSVSPSAEATAATPPSASVAPGPSSVSVAPQDPYAAATAAGASAVCADGTWSFR